MVVILYSIIRNLTPVTFYGSITADKSTLSKNNFIYLDILVIDYLYWFD